ncbi:MAG: 16S rRNA processing protein RimM [Prevotella sp.]|nr:16S rRNA processing protein RimM [Prevotella sp.]
MIKQDEVYRIGRLGKVHGVKGELTFQVEDDVFDRVEADYLILDMDGILVPFFMEAYRFRSSESVLVTFEGVDTAEKAQALVGREVFFPRALSDSSDDSVSWNEILGFSVIDEATQQRLGTLQHIDTTTANLLFEVETEAGHTLLLPAPSALIHHADMDARTIRMAIPHGLLDL